MRVAFQLERRPELRNTTVVKGGFKGTVIAWRDGSRDHQGGTVGSSVRSPGEGLRDREEALTVG